MDGCAELIAEALHHKGLSGTGEGDHLAWSLQSTCAPSPVQILLDSIGQTHLCSVIEGGVEKL